MWAASAVDGKRDRFILFGGYDGSNHNDLWYHDLTGPADWHAIVTQGDVPPRMYGASGVYDPGTDRFVLFGGFDETTYRQETWLLDFSTAPPTWTRILPGVAPAGRAFHSSVIDPTRRLMLVFGGKVPASPYVSNDVWAFSLDSLTWTQIVPAGTPPTRRDGHASVFDVARDRMLVLQGEGENALLADTWALEFASGPQWVQVVTSGPAHAMYGHCATLDPVRDRVAILAPPGGFQSAITLSLSGTPTWSAPSNDDPVLDRGFATAALDSERDRMLVFGGRKYWDGIRSSELLALSLADPNSWTVISPQSNLWIGRVGHGWIHDVARDRMVVFGGGSSEAIGEKFPNDVWALPLATPNQRVRLWPSGQAPNRSATDRPRGIFDPIRDRAIVFGGRQPDGTCSKEVWSFNLAESTGWQQLAVTGGPVDGFWNHTVVYDPVRDRVICFGGSCSTISEVWVLPLDTPTLAWSKLTTAGPSPGFRAEHSMVYDPARDRMLLFSGQDWSEYLDLWELTLGATPTWRRLIDQTFQSPPVLRGRLHASLVYDPIRDRLVTFGGRDNTSYTYPTLYDDQAWSLDLQAETLAWERLSPSGPTPSGRELASAVFDVARDRLVLFGGATSETQIPTVEVLEFTPPLAVPTRPVLRIALAPPRPNPSTGVAEFSFALPSAAHVRLVIHDLQGRRLATLIDRYLEPGVHEVRWNGRSHDGSAVRAGVYLAGLRVGDQSIERRVVRMN